MMLIDRALTAYHDLIQTTGRVGTCPDISEYDNQRGGTYAQVRALPSQKCQRRRLDAGLDSFRRIENAFCRVFGLKEVDRPSSIITSAAATPPADHALRSVRAAA